MAKRGLSSRNLKRLIKKEKEIQLNKFRSIFEENNASISGININISTCERTEEEADLENVQNEIYTVCFKDKLLKWYDKYCPSRESFEALLHILREEGLEVPHSLKGLRGKTEKIKPRTVAPGQYYHFGITKQIEKIPEIYKFDQLIFDIGIDGLPLYKSSRQQLWPILGHIVNVPNCKVMLIGSFLGKSKPNCADNYLHDLVNELKSLLSFGMVIHEKTIKFKIRAFICDAPARSFICGTVGHNALKGCSKCTQIGKSVNNTVTFSSKSGSLRTDTDFCERTDKEDHKQFYWERKSSLELLGIDMVSQFPIDPMHVIDLGVVKKILVKLCEGSTTAMKMSKSDRDTLSANLKYLAPFIPREFCRKPRGLEELSRWKATEFRQFALYTGIVVLKDILNEDYYYHFLLLHRAL